MIKERKIFEYFYNYNNANKFIEAFKILHYPYGDTDFDIMFDGYTRSILQYSDEEIKKWYIQLKNKHQVDDKFILKIINS